MRPGVICLDLRGARTRDASEDLEVALTVSQKTPQVTTQYEDCEARWAP